MTKRVFLIENNPLLLESSAAHLRSGGFEVHEYSRTFGIMDDVSRLHPQLVILGVGIPDRNAFDVARQIRETQNTPYMFLASRESEVEELRQFGVDADLYLLRPFSNGELRLRVESILRRNVVPSITVDVPISFEIWNNEGLELRVDPVKRIGYIDGDELKLTASEWKILSYLLQRSGEFCSRNHILLDALGYQYCGSSRTVDTHIKNLRIKLHSSLWIETVRNSGYRFKGIQA